MTANEREQLRRELIDQLTVIYQKVRADLSAEVVAGALERDPGDESEESAMDELRALDASLDERERHLVHSMEDALRRMRSEQYGVCIACDCPIPFERLRAVPWTLRCAEDETRSEDSQGSGPHATL